MARSQNRVASRRRRKRVIERAQGYYGRRKSSIRAAHDATMHADAYAYRHRREKKRDFRQLWIARISAALAPLGLNYSRFIHGLKRGHVKLNRKVLSEMAIHQKQSFEHVVNQAKQFLTKTA